MKSRTLGVKSHLKYLHNDYFNLVINRNCEIKRKMFMTLFLMSFVCFCVSLASWFKTEVLTLIETRSLNSYRYFSRKCSEFKVVPHQISCIKILLRSIFKVSTCIAKLKTKNWGSVCIVLSNGAMNLTYFHLNPKFV